MKNFSIIKVGYSAGVYGCSAEYFLAIYTQDNELKCIDFYGMYGAEHRIKEEFKKLGYIENYIYCNYSQCKAKDMKHFINEYEAIEKIKNIEI